MSGPSSPIDITPARVSSASPRSSNLTTALQEAATRPSNAPMDIPRRKNNNNNNSNSSNDINGRPSISRQDSLGFGLDSSHAGARPISGAGKARRESAAGGSFMGGMSWGGISVGSWVQDDVMMGGTSPYNVQSPSFHSSSYLPKMEANFWNNLRCCEQGFPDLHELLQHFEDVHSQQPSTFPYRMSVPSGERLYRRKSSTNVSSAAAGNQVRGFPAGGDYKLGANPSIKPPSQTSNGFNKSSLSTMQDIDTLEDMEMDDDNDATAAGPSHPFQPRRDGYVQDAASSMAPANPSLVAGMHDGQGYNGSHMTTPSAGVKELQRQNNPLVSAVNAPPIGTQVLQGQQQHSNLNGNLDHMNSGLALDADMEFDPATLQSLNDTFGSLDFGHNGNEMLDLCINDPAKALFTDSGTINAQQYPQFSFLNNGAQNSDDAARKLQAQQLAVAKAKLAGEEDRPFKCPVIGCEKAYKNANGLRYHEKHGHSTQKLKENGDGTFSIVDPVTSIPYPGTIGMEKEKPYRCEVCGKRYKNLNGLKYHRNHSPPCNPDFNFNNVALPGMQQSTINESIYQ